VDTENYSGARSGGDTGWATVAAAGWVWRGVARVIVDVSFLQDEDTDWTGKHVRIIHLMIRLLIRIY
jgi:hypothetical protein